MSPAPPFTVMGIVNVTPDSFSDGGLYLDPEAAIAHGRELARDGAAILDIGGESTRPGAAPVDAATELARVLPVIEGLTGALEPGVRLSIDTTKLEVARAALAAGASLINDVAAFRFDPGLVELAAETGAEVCLVHMLGEPRTMQAEPHYRDVVDDVRAFLEERLAFVVEHGVDERRVMLDPGIGFGKTVAHNLALLNRLDRLVAIGPPLLIGTSRKSFLGSLTGRERPEDRLAATLATTVVAFERGASVFRVHDVAETRDALLVTAALGGS
jgi:dihydropteroate synthase